MIVNLHEEITGLRFDNGIDGMRERGLIAKACGERIIGLARSVSGRQNQYDYLVTDEMTSLGALVDRLEDGIPEPEIAESGLLGDQNPSLIAALTGLKPGTEVDNFFEAEEVELIESVLSYFVDNTAQVIVELSEKDEPDISYVINRTRDTVMANSMLDAIRKATKKA